MRPRLAPVVCAVLLIPSLLAAQAAIKDLPLSAAERQQFIGVYAVTPSPGKPAMPLHVFERGDTLMGQLRNTDPTRLISQGDNVFRPSASRDFTIEFTIAGGKATQVSIVSKDGTMRGVRTDDAAMGAPTPQDPSTSGALFDELARMDSLVFDATYVACDTQRINALFTDDVEFYHDRTGFHSGAEVRADFARLAATCPRGRGVTRELIPGTLRVYPIHDYGAVQMGMHRFVEKGSSTATVAQFVHVWRKKDGVWKISRELSFEHRGADAP
jgi:ketosteroid isomerase-like protein